MGSGVGSGVDGTGRGAGIVIVPEELEVVCDD